MLGWLQPSLGSQELGVGFGDRAAEGGVGQAGRQVWPILWWKRMLRFVAVPKLLVLLCKSLLHLPGVFGPLVAP